MAWLELNVLAELFGLDGALGSRVLVEDEIYSGTRRAKLLENFPDFFLILGRAHPKDTTAPFLPQNI